MIRNFLIAAVLLCSLAACNVSQSDNNPTPTLESEIITPDLPTLTPTTPPVGDGSGAGPIGGNPDDPGGLSYFLVSSEDGTGRTPFGCQQYLVPHGSGVQFSNDTATDIQAALEAMFAASMTDEENFWQGGTVNSISLEGERLTLDLTGYMPSGVCADVAAKAQLLMVVFNNSDVQEALITVNGQNFKQAIDATGNVGADEPFTREEMLAIPA